MNIINGAFRMTEKRKKIYGAYGLLALLLVSVYFGLFSENVGLNNIGMTILWGYAGLLFLSMFLDEVKEDTKDVDNIGLFVKWFARITYYSTIFIIIYKGSIIIGTIMAFGVLVGYVRKRRGKNDDKHTEGI